MSARSSKTHSGASISSLSFQGTHAGSFLDGLPILPGDSEDAPVLNLASRSIILRDQLPSPGPNCTPRRCRYAHEQMPETLHLRSYRGSGCLLCEPCHCQITGSRCFDVLYSKKVQYYRRCSTLGMGGPGSSDLCAMSVLVQEL